MKKRLLNLAVLIILIFSTLIGCKIGDYEVDCKNDGCGEYENYELKCDENSCNFLEIIPEIPDSPEADGNFEPDDVPDDEEVKCGGKYNLLSPAKGIFGPFPYYDSNPSDTSDRNTLEMCPEWEKRNFTKVTTSCSDGTIYSWTVNVKAASTFKKVQEKFCDFITKGVDGIVYTKSDINISGPTVIRFISNSKSISLHSYGIAIDINPSSSYIINGKKYTHPYGREIEKYYDFINALGSENDKRNINYVLWRKVFQPLGFTWGGNWERNGNSGIYDGMHFEIDWRQTRQ